MNAKIIYEDSKRPKSARYQAGGQAAESRPASSTSTNEKTATGDRLPGLTGDRCLLRHVQITEDAICVCHRLRRQVSFEFSTARHHLTGEGDKCTPCTRWQITRGLTIRSILVGPRTRSSVNVFDQHPTWGPPQKTPKKHAGNRGCTEKNSVRRSPKTRHFFQFFVASTRARWVQPG